MRILLSRTDRIGDVALTLPMAGVIKEYYPNCEVHFLCREYTHPLAHRNALIDRVLDWEQIRKAKSTPEADYFIHVFPDSAIARFARDHHYAHRIGTSHRWYHWHTCNHLVHFTRRRSHLHESQLNLKLLKPLKIRKIPSVEELYGYIQWIPGKSSVSPLNSKFSLIFHMKSSGSGKEWPLLNYVQLAQKLPKDQYAIYLTGTESEGILMRNAVPEMFQLPHVTDLTGAFALNDFISFIEQCDGLLASGTGPLHLAGLAGIKTLGLFPAKRPIDPTRWAALGPQTSFLTDKISARDQYLHISVQEVFSAISKWA